MQKERQPRTKARDPCLSSQRRRADAGHSRPTPGPKRKQTCAKMATIVKLKTIMRMATIVKLKTIMRHENNVCEFWGNQNSINPGIKTHPTFGWSSVLFLRVYSQTYIQSFIRKSGTIRSRRILYKWKGCNVKYSKGKLQSLARFIFTWADEVRDLLAKPPHQEGQQSGARSHSWRQALHEVRNASERCRERDHQQDCYSWEHAQTRHCT